MTAILLKSVFKIVHAHNLRSWPLHFLKQAFSKVSCVSSEVVRNSAIFLNIAGNSDAYVCTILQKKLFRTHQTFRLLATSRNRCWQCNSVITERDLVCLSCGCVQEPKEHLNYFEIFKESPHFDIDFKILTIKYRRLQSLLHPDKFATHPEKEQQYSIEQSSHVNRAYQILRNPLERGLYLLELHKRPLLEDEVTMSPDFLEDIMEINENLSKCEDANLVISIRNANNARLEVLFSELTQSFKEKNIERARETLAKLKYFVSIDNRIKKIEEDLGISSDD